MAICFDHPDKEKRVYANFSDPVDKMTLSQAVERLNIIGEHPDGGYIVLNKKKGYYLTHMKKHYALSSYEGDCTKMTSVDAVDIINKGGLTMAREADPMERDISPEWKIKKGPYGYYLKYKGIKNIKIPKKYLANLETIDLKICTDILESEGSKFKGKVNATPKEAKEAPKEAKKPKEAKEAPKEAKKPKDPKEAKEAKEAPKKAKKSKV
jgi:topoisomerase IA-like protein